jgi:high-affinity iron transporter
LGIRYHWVGFGLVAGLLCAAIYGFNIDRVSEWLDGVGQEVVNALLQLAIYALLCVLMAIAARYYSQRRFSREPLAVILGLCISLAVAREGSEIMIYLSAFLQVQDLLMPVLMGSIIGAGIGLSVGALFYYVLLSMKARTAMIFGAVLMTFVAGGMVMQAMKLLIQADWVPSQYPAWDSSWLVAEGSVTGEVLYALIGYEATPTPLQLIAYVAAVGVLILGVYVFGIMRGRADA